MGNFYGDGASKYGPSLGAGGAFEGALSGIAFGERLIEAELRRKAMRQKMVQDQQRLGYEHDRLIMEKEKQDMLLASLVGGAGQPDALDQILGQSGGGGGGRSGGKRTIQGRGGSAGSDGWVDSRTGLERGAPTPEEVGRRAEAQHTLSTVGHGEDMRVPRMERDRITAGEAEVRNRELEEALAARDAFQPRSKDYLSEEDKLWRNADTAEAPRSYEEAVAGSGYGVAGESVRGGGLEGERVPMSDDALRDAALLLAEAEANRESELATAVAAEGQIPIKEDQPVASAGGRARDAKHEELMATIAADDFDPYRLEGENQPMSPLGEALYEGQLAAGAAGRPRSADPQTEIQKALGHRNVGAEKLGYEPSKVLSQGEIAMLKIPRVAKMFGLRPDEVDGLIQDNDAFRTALSRDIAEQEIPEDRSERLTVFRNLIEQVNVDPKTGKPRMSDEQMDRFAEGLMNAPTEVANKAIKSLETTVGTLEKALANVQVSINPNERARIAKDMFGETVREMRTYAAEMTDLDQKLADPTISAEDKAEIRGRLVTLQDKYDKAEASRIGLEALAYSLLGGKVPTGYFDVSDDGGDGDAGDGRTLNDETFGAVTEQEAGFIRRARAGDFSDEQIQAELSKKRGEAVEIIVPPELSDAEIEAMPKAERPAGRKLPESYTAPQPTPPEETVIGKTRASLVDRHKPTVTRRKAELPVLSERLQGAAASSNVEEARSVEMAAADALTELQRIQGEAMRTTGLPFTGDLSKSIGEARDLLERARRTREALGGGDMGAVRSGDDDPLPFGEDLERAAKGVLPDFMVPDL